MISDRKVEVISEYIRNTGGMFDRPAQLLCTAAQPSDGLSDLVTGVRGIRFSYHAGNPVVLTNKPLT